MVVDYEARATAVEERRGYAAGIGKKKS